MAEAKNEASFICNGQYQQAVESIVLSGEIRYNFP